MCCSMQEKRACFKCLANVATLLATRLVGLRADSPRRLHWTLSLHLISVFNHLLIIILYIYQKATNLQTVSAVLCWVTSSVTSLLVIELQTLSSQSSSSSSLSASLSAVAAGTIVMFADVSDVVRFMLCRASTTAAVIESVVVDVLRWARSTVTMNNSDNFILT